MKLLPQTKEDKVLYFIYLIFIINALICFWNTSLGFSLILGVLVCNVLLLIYQTNLGENYISYYHRDILKANIDASKPKSFNVLDKQVFFKKELIEHPDKRLRKIAFWCIVFYKSMLFNACTLSYVIIFAFVVALFAK